MMCPGHDLPFWWFTWCFPLVPMSVSFPALLARPAAPALIPVNLADLSAKQLDELLITPPAYLLVDWDEKLGLGMEQFPVPVTPATTQWYPGDGGLIARFSDGTMTDATWKAQTFFIAPLVDPKEVVEVGNVHDTPNLGGRTHPFARKPNCEDKCYAVHYPIPANWQSPRFNDTNWPRAWEFTDQEIGVTNLPAYTRYPELFAGARWIWTQNLVLDNVVIARKTVR